MEENETDKQVRQVKSLRRSIDEVIQEVRQVKSSREVSLTITKLQEGVMWLGMELKRIGQENPGLISPPYPDGKNPENTKIQPVAGGLKL